MRIDQNAIITILLSGFMTFAAVAQEWREWKYTSWTEPVAGQGWSAPQEFKAMGDRNLNFRLGNNNQGCMDVYYDDKDHIVFDNWGNTKLEYHARDEHGNRWLQETIDPKQQHTAEGGEAKIWVKWA